MSPASRNVTAYLFGPFRLSVPDRILERNGERVQLTPKVIDTLFVLVENARQVVTKEALMKAVWPDVTVVESGLTRNISALRKALEEGLEEGSYIETIPKRGYRFLMEVREEAKVPEQPAQPAVPEPVIIAPPAPRPQRSRLWIIPAVALVSIIAIWASRDPRAPKAGAPVDPQVRIGEHLLYKLAPEQTVRASEQFQQAVSATPSSAAAHAGLSVSLLHLSTLGVQSLAEVADRAEQAATRSLELDPNLATAHYAMASLHLLRDWQFGKAEASYRRALQLDPSSAQSRFGYAQLKLSTGDVNGAIRLIEEALRLDPASPPLGTQYCRAFYFARDYRRAESECRKVLDREPGYTLAHYYLALSLGALGRTAEARQSLDRTALMPGVLEADRAWLSLLDGDRKPAMSVLEKRRALIAQGKVNASAKLLLATILGRMDEAYEALEAGLSTHAVELLTIHIEPRLDPIRTDPRYSDLLRRVRGANFSLRGTLVPPRTCEARRVPQALDLSPSNKTTYNL
jgi:DNA-binding winged helix-turn-helix (wHTH) protein/tetratricopeptide (TPR) repeat protein